jgi:AMP deaminase
VPFSWDASPGFQPLFEVTRDPSSDPHLHELLCSLGGVDSVDDESQWDVLHFDVNKFPADVRTDQQPVYSYYMYYYYANLAALNRFRAFRGLNTIPFRPHSGESGAAHHLASTFLVADGIAHGINLRLNLPIQYLYYLAQIPVAMSPLSNNALFLKVVIFSFRTDEGHGVMMLVCLHVGVQLSKSPFREFFARGLRVSLSTDGACLPFSIVRPLSFQRVSISVQTRWCFTTHTRYGENLFLCVVCCVVLVKRTCIVVGDHSPLWKSTAWHSTCLG